MSITEGRWEGNTAFPDLTLFVGADEIRATSGTATLTLNASGDLSLNIGNSQACVFVISEAAMLRSGVYASSYDQQQFGTAAGVAGPTAAVPNTSGPLGLKPGFPPLTAANMATLGAIQRGPIPKGLQVNSVTAIYSVTGLGLTLAQIGVTQTKFTNNAALVVTNVLAKAANGLPTAIGTGAANPYSTVVPMTSPAFTIGSTAGTELLVELDLTTGASGTARLYGMSVNCSFNFN